jgi:hypothetical protein
MPSFDWIIRDFGSVGSFLDEHNGAVAAISTIFVAFFTATLWRATTRLWQSSLRQSRHMEETAERELRAYVLVVRGGIAPGNPPAARIILRNYGRTPAYDVRVWVGVDIARPGKREFPAAPKDLPMGKSIIGPGGELISTERVGRPLAADETIRFARGETWLYAWGEVSYRDAFDNRRLTRFRFMGNAADPEAGLFPCQEGNEAN